MYFTTQERRADALSLKGGTDNILREHHPYFYHGDKKNQIIKTALKLIPMILPSLIYVQSHTFDFPIWLKAVNIIKQANLPIIARLGGFHLLKSYHGSLGNTMDYSGLLDVIQLIYPESTTANHIMDEGLFDKTIRAHLLINAVIYQHIMRLAFTEEECGDMKTFMEKVADRKMGARDSDPVVAVFEQRFEETFKRLAKGGRTPALWVEYHHMVDVMKIFIGTLQTTMCICPALLPRCFTSLPLQAIIIMPRAHGTTCSQGRQRQE